MVGPVRRGWIALLVVTLLAGCTPAPPPQQAAPQSSAPQQGAQPTAQAAAPKPAAQPAAQQAAPPAAQSSGAAPSESERVPKLTVVAPSATYDPRRWEATLVVTNNWKKLGIDVNLEVVPDINALTARTPVAPWNWDAEIQGFIGRPDRLDPDEMVSRPWHSSGIADKGPNEAGYKSAEYDQVADAQRKETDPEKRRQLVYKAQEILARDIPEVTLFHRREIFPFNIQKFDNPVVQVGRGLWNIWTMVQATPKTNDKILKVAWATDIATTNPLALNSAIETLRYTYDRLAEVAPDGQAVPWAAESWKQVDPTTVEVTLRPNMKFHDGEPVTANDVKFSYDFIKQFATAPFLKTSTQPIKSVDVVNDRTVRFTLTEPYPPLFFVTFTQVYILPKHIWQDIAQKENLDTPAKWNNPKPVGSGPFKLIYHRPGEEIKLEAFKEHFNAPKVDGVLIIKQASIDTVFVTLMQGQADMPDMGISPQQVEEAKRNPNIKLFDSPDHGVYFMEFNLRRAPFNDLKFRQAIAHTFDFGTIVSALGSYAEPGTGMIAPANKFWHNPAWEEWLKGPYKFDLEAARKMLQEAGYRWDSAGNLYYPAGGPPVK